MRKPIRRRAYRPTLPLLLLFVVTLGELRAEGFQWISVDPDDVGLDSQVLRQFEDRLRRSPETNIHSFLVVRDGKLAYEAYFAGKDQDWGTDLGEIQFDRDTRHDLRSVTKSVTSALIGIAIAEGKLPGVETGVPDLFPEYSEKISPDKRALRLKHILTMTAGLDWFEPSDYTNPGNDEIRLISSPDPVAFVLGRSFATRPGDKFQYNGGLPTLLGYLLERAYGKRGDEVAREKLFEPLGISGFDFRSNASGLLAYASGLRLTPRDMGRIGVLYLDGGKWEGKQLIPARWIEDSLTPHTETGWTPGYGYQWWVMKYESASRSMWVPVAVGNGGQRIFLLRPLNIVVVITAGNYNSVDVPLSGSRILEEVVFPAAGIAQMKAVFKN